MSKDNINPAYYQKGKCSCGKVLHTYDFVKDLAYPEASAIKYLVRHRDKNGVEDVQKSMWFSIALLIKEYGMTGKEVKEFIDNLLVKEYGGQ